MEHGHHSYAADSAMTEIALALAMGFFSIMVLTMVSMGAGGLAKEKPADTVQTAALAPAKSQDKGENGQVQPAAQDMIIIYHNGRFMDQKLGAIDPARLPMSGRLILAVAPDLPMAEALEIRARINREDLIVSTLDDRWLKRLGGMAQ